MKLYYVFWWFWRGKEGFDEHWIDRHKTQARHIDKIGFIEYTSWTFWSGMLNDGRLIENLRAFWIECFRI